MYSRLGFPERNGHRCCFHKLSTGGGTAVVDRLVMEIARGKRGSIAGDSEGALMSGSPANGHSKNRRKGLTEAGFSYSWVHSFPDRAHCGDWIFFAKSARGIEACSPVPRFFNANDPDATSFSPT